LNINEIEQIRLLNTKAPNGYNLTDGGDICFRRPEFESSDIIEKFNELKTASAVSKFFKTDIQNITRILKENNIHYGTALSNCQKRKIFEMLENGYKPIEISRHLGLHRSTVRKFLKRI
jgi:DNA-binding NarL/FixJ family response regulator